MKCIYFCILFDSDRRLVEQLEEIGFKSQVEKVDSNHKYLSRCAPFFEPLIIRFTNSISEQTWLVRGEQWLQSGAWPAVGLNKFVITYDLLLISYEHVIYSKRTWNIIYHLKKS